MLFKFGLLSQTDWENMAITFSKCSKMVKFLLAFNFSMIRVQYNYVIVLFKFVPLYMDKKEKIDTDIEIQNIDPQYQILGL